MTTPPDPPAHRFADDELAQRQANLAAGLDAARSSADGLERRLSVLERDFDDLAAAVALRRPARPAAQPTPVPAAPSTTAPPAPDVTARAAPAPAPRTAQAPPQARPAPAPPKRRTDVVERLMDVDYADLFGARVLAWVGGAVTALGVVLLFVFAVNRGWITPELRVAFGALASGAVFASGIELRRRFGTTYSALGAVGAGIAGGYATLLAAGVLYDLVSGWTALPVAGAIAAAGTATAVVWRSEIVAGIGLVGALLVPVAAAPDTGITALGTAFAAVVLAGTAVVSTRLLWPKLLSVALAVSLPQAAALIVQRDDGTGALVALAAAFALAYAASAVAFQRARALPGVAGLPVSLVLASATVATLAAGLLTGEGTSRGVDREGLVFALVAVAYGGAAAAVYVLVRARSLGVVFAAVGLTLGGHALAELLSGRTLAVAFALQAVALAWLAQRVGDRRLQLGSLAYLALAAGHAVAVDTPPEYFTEPDVHPAAGTPSLVAVALAAPAVARFARGWSHRGDEGGVLGLLEKASTALVRRSGELRLLLYAGAGAVAAYAAALGILEVGQWMGDDLVASFDWSHVAVSVVLAVAGLGATLLPTEWRTRVVTGAALGALGAAAVKVATFDLDRLADTPRGSSAVAVGALLAVAATALVRRSAAYGDALALIVLGVALPLEVAGTLVLTCDTTWGAADASGLALLALAAGHAALTAVTFTRTYGRDHSAAQGLAALLLTGAATHDLLDGTWRTVALASVGAALAGLAVALRERRALAGAAGFSAVAAAYAVLVQAPPGDLFTAQAHPASGVPAVLAALAAAAVLLAAERRTTGVARRLPASVERTVAALVLLWTRALAVGGVYAASLGILELAELVLSGSVEADFQRGHTAVSAFWAVVGVALLHGGLVHGRRALRAAGFIALGLTLVKIFAYDLATLSAAARSASFLAVGALLLFGGFLYQRLADGGGNHGRGAPA